MYNRDYCCEFVEYCEIKDVSSCEIWKRNKDIAKFEKAKAELKSKLSKPFIKFLDWLERVLNK